MADARRDVAAKSTALRTLQRRVKDLWKFLGCGAVWRWQPRRCRPAAIGLPTALKMLSISLSLALCLSIYLSSVSVSASLYAEHGVKGYETVF